MYLNEGDLIGIVSPSRAISEEDISLAVKLMEDAGFRIAVGMNAHKVNNQYAGTDREKIADIQSFINNKEIKAIWSSRGGYGGVRIIDKLDLSPIWSHFKWMMGYSDFTVFHSHIHRHLSVPTLHCTMPVNLKSEEDEIQMRSLDSMIAALTGDKLVYETRGHELNREGEASGELVGGNLSILYSLCGSNSDISTEGKILFLEDLDEYLYHIDRMMMNLKRTGKLDKLAALVIGGMSDMNDNAIPYGKTAEEIIHEHTAEFNYPVLYGLQSGHLDLNLALRLGMKAEIKNNSLILPS